MFKSKKNHFGQYRFDTKLSTEKLSRRNIIFLHVLKTGGTSFWHSFSAALNFDNTLNYAVVDAHDTATKCLGSPNKSLEGLSIIKSEYIKHNLSRLIVHYHSPHGDLTNVLSNPTIIIMFREPLARLRSGFRHWRKTNPKRDLEDFFTNAFSMGINYYLAGCLPYCVSALSSPPDFLIDYIKKNVIFIHLNDYRLRTDIIKLIEKELAIPEIEVNHFSGTITDKSYDKELDSLLCSDEGFSRQWQQHLDAEVMWHKVFNLDV
ncbi:MAG: sulfotransferase family 2 domain-containing protein [Methylococcaceae bacterium]